MKKLNFKDNNVLLASILMGVILYSAIVPETAAAALPWESPLDELQESITGPVAAAVCAIIVCVCGFMIAMGEGGATGRLALRLIFGLALAIGFMNVISIFS